MAASRASGSGWDRPERSSGKADVKPVRLATSARSSVMRTFGMSRSTSASSWSAAAGVVAGKRDHAQFVALQLDAVERAPLQRVTETAQSPVEQLCTSVEIAVGVRVERQVRRDCCGEDDVVVVTRLDRLARSTRDLLDIAEKLNEASAGLRSLAEPWADTTSPAGGMVLTVFPGIAEFERVLIHQRPTSGRIAAKARGVRFGRPSKLSPEQIALGRRLIGEGYVGARSGETSQMPSRRAVPIAQRADRRALISLAKRSAYRCPCNKP